MNTEQQFTEWSNYIEQNKYTGSCGVACSPALYDYLYANSNVIQKDTKGYGKLRIICGNFLFWNKTGIDFIVFYDQNLFGAFRDHYIPYNEDNTAWIDWVIKVFSSPENPDRAAIKIVGCSQEYTAADLLALEFGYTNL